MEVDIFDVTFWSDVQQQLADDVYEAWWKSSLSRLPPISIALQLRSTYTDWESLETYRREFPVSSNDNAVEKK